MIPASAAATTYRGLVYTPTNALSDEAQKLGNAWYQMLQTFANVASIRPRVNAIRELESAYEQCRTGNWDGEGAAPITEATYQEAVKFLELLPFTVATPEIVPEPNGSLGFEWSRNHKVFVVSVKGRQTLSYAAAGIQFPAGQAPYGSLNFSDSIPPFVITTIPRLREA